jgi:hypothetical protein
MTSVQRAIRLLAVLVAGSAAIALPFAGVGRAGGPAAVPPAVAPAPSPPLLTPALRLTRIGPSGTSQVVVVQPDGEWMFTPYRGSQRASVINYGRMTPAEHRAVAGTLASAAFRAEAAMPPGGCPHATSYDLAVGGLDAVWTDCDAADRPVLSGLVDRIVAIVRF